MSRRLRDVRLAVLMLDGIDLKGATNVDALGISADGVKIPLGLWQGSPSTPRSPPRRWPSWSTAVWTSSKGAVRAGCRHGLQ